MGQWAGNADSNLIPKSFLFSGYSHVIRQKSVVTDIGGPSIHLKGKLRGQTHDITGKEGYYANDDKHSLSDLVGIAQLATHQTSQKRAQNEISLSFPAFRPNSNQSHLDAKDNRFHGIFYFEFCILNILDFIVQTSLRSVELLCLS